MLSTVNDVIILKQPDYRATSETLFASFYHSIDFIQLSALNKCDKKHSRQFCKGEVEMFTRAYFEAIQSADSAT
jgi:hypothetical protein